MERAWGHLSQPFSNWVYVSQQRFRNSGFWTSAPKQRPDWHRTQEAAFSFFMFWPRPRRQKFLGQGLNPYHSRDPSHSSDNARSLTVRPPGNSRNLQTETSLLCWVISICLFRPVLHPSPSNHVPRRQMVSTALGFGIQLGSDNGKPKQEKRVWEGQEASL